MAHFLAGRRGGASDESDHGLLDRARVFGGRFFHAATDFAHDNDGVSAGILIERL